jgi:hypothetical protein
MLQAILGHASITTTLDLYGHLYPGEMDKYATASTMRPRRPVRPKSGQKTRKTTRKSHDRAVYQRKLWRTRRCLGGTRTPNLLIRS